MNQKSTEINRNQMKKIKMDNIKTDWIKIDVK